MILAMTELDIDPGSNPASPSSGDSYYNIQADEIRVYTGSSWLVVGSGAAIRDALRNEQTIARVKYAGRDYGTFYDEILAFLKDSYEDDFNDVVASQLGVMLVRFVSWGLDSLSWYMDKQSEEMYIPVARLRTSVNRLAKLLGYKIDPSVNASVDLSIGIDQNYGFDILIPKRFQLNGPNGLIYELAQDVTFTSAEQAAASSFPLTKTEYIAGSNISAYEGETKYATFVSDGLANQTFKVANVPGNKAIAKDSVELTVDGVTWDENDFLEFEQTNQYMVDYSADPPTVRFGDGIIGNIPAQGSEIKVTYVAGSGTSGEVAASTITSFRSSLVVSFQTIGLSVNNPTPSSGSAPAETLSSVRANAPIWYRTADRGVTQSDVRALAEKFSHGVYGAVAKAVALHLMGVANESTIQARLTAIDSAVNALTVYLVAITGYGTEINTLTSGVKTTHTPAVRTEVTNVGTVVTTLGTDVTNIKAHTADARTDLALATTRAQRLPWQDVLGEGDGSTTLFVKTLPVTNLVERSVCVVVDPQVASSRSDGDCDTDPGFVIVGAAFFSDPADYGKLIQIGAEKRQIEEIISDVKVRYSGPRIYDTNLYVAKFGDAIVGYDDGAGSISGTGISAGSVTYSSGLISLTFNTAPEGISGKYGKKILVTCQYENSAVTTAITDAETDLDSADTDADQVNTDAGNISTATTNIGTSADSIDTEMDNIDVKVTSIGSSVSSAGGVPTNVQVAVDNLEAYLDDVISGECKANIVQVQALTVDSDGFYSAPSNGLITALKTELDTKKIATTTISVISGVASLIEVDVEVRVKVKVAFTASDVLNEVRTQVDEVFKGRNYGQSLRMDEFNQAFRENVVTDAGETKYDYVNLKIVDPGGIRFQDPSVTGTLPTVNSEGDLEIEEFYIITKGANTSVTQITS